eukprot:evm.model.scf_429.4 EVM.evm.TU.scf_429.4   scf_429:29564-36836(+)
MAAGIVAAGAAALAYYAYRRRQGGGIYRRVETHTDVEHAPSNWTGELYLFAEGVRYIWVEIVGRWPTADLFIGIFYLFRQGIRDFPAREVVANGERVDPTELPVTALQNLKDQLCEAHRLLQYGQNLKHASLTVSEEVWANMGIGAHDFIIYRPRAAVLRPAFVLVWDHELHLLVLAIRGTSSVKDIFTSLSGVTKPHHVVDQDGVVLGYSHFGMLASARWILKEASPAIKNAMQEHPSCGLRITGHSMGGGTAAMLTMMIREHHPEFGDVQCTAFACPSCLTLDLAQSCKSYVTSYIYGTDFVPTLSAGSLDQLKEEVAESSWGSAMRQDMRSYSVVKAVEGSIKGVVRSASTWTSRSLESASWGIRACYAARCTAPRRGAAQAREQKQGAQALACEPKSGEDLPGSSSSSMTAGDPRGTESTHEAAATKEAASLTSSTEVQTQPAQPRLAASAECGNECSQDAAGPSNTDKDGLAESATAKQETKGGTTYERISSGVFQFGGQLQRTGGMMAKYSSNLWTSMVNKRPPGSTDAQSTGEKEVPLLNAGEQSMCTDASVADIENLETGDEMEPAEEEGVFDGRKAQGMEDQNCSASSGSIADMQWRRLLYPAGRILHLVPAYILDADSERDADRELLDSNVLREMEACLMDGSIDSGNVKTMEAKANGANAPSSQRGDLGGSEEDQCELPVSTHMTGLDKDSKDDEGSVAEECDGGDHGEAGKAPLQETQEGGCGEHVLFLDVPQEPYGKMRMCRSMVMDHFVPRYLAALESMIEALQRASGDS